MCTVKLADGKAASAESAKTEAISRMILSLNKVKDRKEHEERKLELAKWKCRSIIHTVVNAYATVNIALYRLKGIKKGDEEFMKRSYKIEEDFWSLTSTIKKLREKATMDEINEDSKKAKAFEIELREFSEGCEGDIKEELNEQASVITKAAADMEKIGDETKKRVDLQSVFSENGWSHLEVGEGGNDFFVFGSQFSVEMVIQNILFNATKAVEEVKGGRIEVTIRKEGETIGLTVLNSTKLSEENVKQVDSQKFFELGVTTKEGSGGRGLAIVKFFVEELGGIVYTFTAPPFEGETSPAFGITVLLPAHKD